MATFSGFLTQLSALGRGPQLCAIEAAARLRSDVAVRFLRPLVWNEDAVLRQAAVRALQTHKSTPGVLSVLEYVRESDPSDMVRGAAQDAVR